MLQWSAQHKSILLPEQVTRCDNELHPFREKQNIESHLSILIEKYNLCSAPLNSYIHFFKIT